MAFWNSSQAPKRAFRFKVQVNNLEGGAIWFAKSCTKPQLEIAEATHKYLGHTFHFPGGATWSDVTITLVDPGEPDVASQVLEMINAAGYDNPKDPGAPGGLNTVGKAKMVNAISGITISQLDADGEVIEEFTLNNPIIKNVNFSELSYETEDLSTIELMVAYDWPTFTGKEGNQLFYDGSDVATG